MESAEFVIFHVISWSWQRQNKRREFLNDRQQKWYFHSTEIFFSFLYNFPNQTCDLNHFIKGNIFVGVVQKIIKSLVRFQTKYILDEAVKWSQSYWNKKINRYFTILDKVTKLQVRFSCLSFARYKGLLFILIKTVVFRIIQCSQGFFWRYFLAFL